MKPQFLLLAFVASICPSFAEYHPVRNAELAENLRHDHVKAYIKPLKRCSGRTNIVFDDGTGELLGIEGKVACKFPSCRDPETPATGEVNAQIIVGKEEEGLCFLEKYTIPAARRRELRLKTGRLPLPKPLGHFEHLDEHQQGVLRNRIAHGVTYQKDTQHLEYYMPHNHRHGHRMRSHRGIINPHDRRNHHGHPNRRPHNHRHSHRMRSHRGIINPHDRRNHHGHPNLRHNREDRGENGEDGGYSSGIVNYGNRREEKQPKYLQQQEGNSSYDRVRSPAGHQNRDNHSDGEEQYEYPQQVGNSGDYRRGGSDDNGYYRGRD